MWQMSDYVQANNIFLANPKDKKVAYRKANWQTLK
jgi:hypothetical protein